MAIALRSLSRSSREFDPAIAAMRSPTGLPLLPPDESAVCGRSDGPAMGGRVPVTARTRWSRSAEVSDATELGVGGSGSSVPLIADDATWSRGRPAESEVLTVAPRCSPASRETSLERRALGGNSMSISVPPWGLATGIAAAAHAAPSAGRSAMNFLLVCEYPW